MYPRCPGCWSGDHVELDEADDLDARGVYRWHCRGCGRRWATH